MKPSKLHNSKANFGTARHGNARGRKRRIKRIIALLCALILLALSATFGAIQLDKAQFKVCIDPGHGGSESTGAVYGDAERLESDDNLRLALLVKAELQKRGVKVIMTRETDKTVSLYERCKIANTKHADLFLCLHRNSSDDKSAHGTEMWISAEPGDGDKLLAENLISKLKEAGISDDRGVKYGFRDETGSDYYINSHTDMPSCLVELGFISNSSDNKDYDEKINEYAAAIAEAAVDTYNALQK